MTDKRRRTTSREWLARLLLAAFGLAVGVATAEIAVRIAAPQSVLLWRPGPFVADGEGYSSVGELLEDLRRAHAALAGGGGV